MTSILLLVSKFEMLSSLQHQLLLSLADFALKSQDNLSGSLSLLVKDWFGLTPESHLLRVITSLSLGKVGSLTGLVLGGLVDLMLLAFLSGTECASFLWHVHHLVRLRTIG